MPAIYGGSSQPVGLFVGLATFDLIQRVPHFPERNGKVTATQVDTSGGGPALNAAVTFAALGGHTVLLSKVGRGNFAKAVQEDLQYHGVQLVDAAPETFQLPVSAVAVEESTGERQIISSDSFPAQASSFLSSPVLAELLDHTQIVLFDGHYSDLALPVATLLSRSNVPRVLDAGRWKPPLAELIPQCSEVICSADFQHPESQGSKELLSTLLRQGVELAAVTNGADPIQWRLPTSHGTIPVPQTPVVDTSGAGDVFHGAYSYARASELPGSDTIEALKFASRVASFKTQFVGTRSWITAIEDI